MAEAIKVLAFDFGASSGRAILGIIEDGKLSCQEIHRFSNDLVEINGSYFWDVLRLFHEIKQGILKCANSGHKDIKSIGIDTWGVDFGLLDKEGMLIGNPYVYRDSRTDGMMEKVFEQIPKNRLYNKTGIQFMKFNTIFQLYALKNSNSYQLKEAKTMLLMPDLFNYFLTGVKAAEYSIASTTQLLDAYSKNWDKEIITKLGLPEEIFPKVVPTGTIIGKVKEDLAKELGLGDVNVIASASHDTQSAIVAVPTKENDFVYISCGTWSLMGIESDIPLINDESYRLAFTNEGGVDGKITCLKNIMGLWLIQESKRQWEREGKVYGFTELGEMARKAEGFRSFIDCDDDIFMAPGNMPERIKEYCRRTNQHVPETVGEVVRCITESLAFKYRQTIEALEELTNNKYSTIHMVGGGIQDKLLCSFTANATGRKVVAGPVEATALGNIAVQAKALGVVDGLNGARELIANSCDTIVYEPNSDATKWNEAYLKYLKIN